MLHAINPISPEDFEGANANLEEALSEELAHAYAPRRLRELGEDDVLRWRERNQDQIAVRGDYMPYRDALRKLLDQAGIVGGDARLKTLEDLKFRTPPAGRVQALAKLIHDHDQSRSLKDWEPHVELSMWQGERDLSEGGRGALGFQKSPGHVPLSPGSKSLGKSYGSLRSATPGSVVLHVQHHVLRSRPQHPVVLRS